MITRFKTVKTKTTALFLLITGLVSLTGCGRAASGEQTISNENIAKEATDIASSYKSIMEGKQTDGLISLSYNEMAEIMNAVAGMGYAVMEASGELDFKNPQIVTGFFSQLDASAKAQMTIIEVCNDGGIIKSDISVKDGKSKITITRVAWKASEPEVTYTAQNDLLDLRYTDKGYLIYKRDIPNNVGCSHDGYIEPTTMTRVVPLDKKCREYCQKYISVIGYSRNNLFLTDWTTQDMKGVVLNDLFPMLYQAAHNATLVLYNCSYRTDIETGYTFVPAEDFETLVMRFFDVTSDEVKKWGVYDVQTNTYPIAASEIYDPGYSVPPIPEVTAYKLNDDGTLTLFVDALDIVNGTDKAFSHVVIIKIENDGSFKYLSNQMVPCEEDILPNYKDPFSDFKIDD